MCTDQSITDLVTRARNGQQQAWDVLVERYAPLVWSICRRHRLSSADASDVGRSVWLQLADQLDHLPNPAALPGWLATITARECQRVFRAARQRPGAEQFPDAEISPDERAEAAEHELHTAERHIALREAFAHLSPCCQRLIVLLTEDPPMTSAQISAKLGIPIESIEPTCSCCLDKLRRHLAGAHHAQCAAALSLPRPPAENGPSAGLCHHI